MSNTKSVSAVSRLYLGVMVVIAAGVNSCANLTLNTTPIRDLKPPQADNTYVSIQGKVTGIVPLIKQKAYQVDDSTGKIWVVTAKSEVKLNDQVKVRGKLRYQDVTVGNNQFGEVYLEE